MLLWDGGYNFWHFLHALPVGRADSFGQKNPRAKVHMCWHLEVNQKMGRNPKSQKGMGGAPMGNAQSCHYLEHYSGF